MSEYLYNKGDLVFYYDWRDDLIIKLEVRHKMSGWSMNDWEYYNCVNSDDHREGYEPSQKELYPTYEKANEERNRYIRGLIRSKYAEINSLKRKIEV